MSTAQFDVVVIGAGAGGLFTAARLAHRGYRTLVVERLDKVGGRASTDDIDGFKVNNGAIVIEVGGITQQTCEEVGRAVRHPRAQPAAAVPHRRQGRRRHRRRLGSYYSVAHPPGREVWSRASARRARLGPARRRDVHRRVGFAVTRKTKACTASSATCARSIFAVGSEDLPARVFLTYFTRKSAFKRFGFHPEGTIGLWRAWPPPSIPRWSSVAVQPGRQDRLRRHRR